VAAYNITLDGDTLRIAFGDPASNDRVVRDAVLRLSQMRENGELRGGPMLKINGPASLPVAVAIAHGVSHLYGTVAIYDPKLQKYVVAICHNGPHEPGDLID